MPLDIFLWLCVGCFRWHCMALILLCGLFKLCSWCWLKGTLQEANANCSQPMQDCLVHWCHWALKWNWSRSVSLHCKLWRFCLPTLLKLLCTGHGSGLCLVLVLSAYANACRLETQPESQPRLLLPPFPRCSRCHANIECCISVQQMSTLTTPPLPTQKSKPEGWGWADSEARMWTPFCWVSAKAFCCCCCCFWMSGLISPGTAHIPLTQQHPSNNTVIATWIVAHVNREHISLFERRPEHIICHLPFSWNLTCVL